MMRLLSGVSYGKRFRRLLPFCPLCGSWTRNVICRECAEEIERELFYENVPIYDSDVRREITFISLYQGLMHEAIDEYKFRGGKSLSFLFGKLIRLYEEKRRESDAHRKSFYIYAPSSTQGMRQRGFNQVELALSESGLEYGEVVLLNRNGRRKQQKALGRMERIEASEGKYELDEQILSEVVARANRIVCTDDILTTGSTMLTIMRLVEMWLRDRNMNGVSIEGLVIARAKDVLAF